MMKFSEVAEAIEDIKNGKMIVVVDDDHRSLSPAGKTLAHGPGRPG